MTSQYAASACRSLQISAVDCRKRQGVRSNLGPTQRADMRAPELRQAIATTILDPSWSNFGHKAIGR